VSLRSIVTIWLISAAILLCLCNFHLDVATPTDISRGRILRVFLEIEKYFNEKGDLPPSLAALGQRNPALILTDGWGNPLHYDVAEDGVITVTSYGRDGKPGGSGWSADRSVSFYSRRPDGRWWVGTVGWIFEARRTDF